MYAVIRSGGKQHKVQAGDVIEVEHLRSQAETVTFRPLLIVEDDGTTHAGKELEKAVVTGKLLGEQKGEKVNIFKYKNKSGYARRAGHRQLMTLVEISEVTLGPAKKPAAKKASDEPAEAGAGS